MAAHPGAPFGFPGSMGIIGATAPETAAANGKVWCDPLVVPTPRVESDQPA